MPMALVKAFSDLVIDSSLSTSTNSAQGLIIAKRSTETPILIVTPSSRRAEELTEEISTYIGREHVAYFPPWETLPHERLSPKSDTIASRFKTLREVLHSKKNRVVVTSIRGFIQPVNNSLITSELISLELGLEIELARLIEELVFFGFTRTDLVERRGDFAVRGGIIDIFPADCEHPVRIDFFGDTIEDISQFTVADQRTFAPIVGKLIIYPCRELLITEEVKKRAAYLAAEFPQISEICHKISQGISVDGMESLTAALTDGISSLVEILPKEYEVTLIDSQRIHSRALDLIKTNEEFLDAAWSNAALGSAAPIDVSSQLRLGGYYTLSALEETVHSRGGVWSSLNPYLSEIDGDIQDRIFEAIPIYSGKIELAVTDISEWLREKYLIIFTASGPGIIERFNQIFIEADIPTRIVENIDSSLTRDAVYLTVAPIEHGFIAHTTKSILLTEKDISGQRSSNKDQARMPSRRKKAIDPLELRTGDFVVHEAHGVGRYVELVQRTAGGISREYMVIEYAPSKRGQPADRLFVPTDTLEQVTRYVGGEAPAVHRIGGADWQNAKRKARKAVKQIAAELIQLYAARMAAPGFAFSPDTPWQRDLEDAFAYVETVDQLSTIE
jgi:transcription-repair coupling factor (superfamily II helicase)